MQVVEYDLRLRTSLAEHRAGPQIPGGGAVEGVGFGFGLAALSDEHHIDTQVMANSGDFWWGGAYSTYFYVDPTVRPNRAKNETSLSRHLVAGAWLCSDAHDCCLDNWHRSTL